MLTLRTAPTFITEVGKKIVVDIIQFIRIPITTTRINILVKPPGIVHRLLISSLHWLNKLANVTTASKLFRLAKLQVTRKIIQNQIEFFFKKCPLRILSTS